MGQVFLPLGPNHLLAIVSRFCPFVPPPTAAWAVWSLGPSWAGRPGVRVRVGVCTSVSVSAGRAGPSRSVDLPEALAACRAPR